MTILNEYIDTSWWEKRSHIRGKRFLVSWIVGWVKRHGLEHVFANYPVTEKEVCAALLYYYEHKEEVDNQDKEELKRVETFFGKYDTDNDGIVSSDDVRKGSAF